MAILFLCMKFLAILFTEKWPLDAALDYLNTQKLQWPFYIAIFVNGHFIFMNEVPGHFINREMAIGCCTELLEYTEIVMAILYCYLCKLPFYK